MLVQQESEVGGGTSGAALGSQGEEHQSDYGQVSTGGELFSRAGDGPVR
jgi:hypothetical protein